MKSILKLSRIFNGDGHCALVKTGANLFQIGQRKYGKEIEKRNQEFFAEAKEIISNLGIKWTGTDDIDTYYGTLIDYARYKNPIETGQNFTPIYYLINQLKHIFLEDEFRLNAIYRRMVYLEILNKEFIYIKKRYDFDKIPILIEWTTNKFETFTALLVELSMIIIEFYYDVTIPSKKSNGQLKFENLINYIKDIEGVDGLFSSIEFTLYGFLAVTLRNNIVHSSGYELVKEKEDIFVLIKEEPVDSKFGILENYIKEVVSKYSGKRIPNTIQLGKDPRFPYLTHHHKISKTGTLDYANMKISFKLKLEEYLELIMEFLFILSRELFDASIKAQTNNLSAA